MIALVIDALAPVQAGPPFNGERVLENTVRLITMIVGVPISLVCIKFGIKALRKRQLDRAWGTLSYALAILVPAAGRAMSFGQPINWVTTALYAASLTAGGIALYYRARWEAWWTRSRPAKQEEQPRDADE
jgi:hypothetical protein